LFIQYNAAFIVKIGVKRFMLILFTALASIAAAAIHAYFTWPAMTVKTKGLAPDIAERVTMPVLFETCSIFFSTGYFLAQFLAHRIGDHQSVALLKVQSRAHIRLLNFMGGVIIISCRYFLRSYYGAPLWENVCMILFGLFLVIMAIINPSFRHPLR
jgi:hypothetical protein